MPDFPFDPYECAACRFAGLVLELCQHHRGRLGITRATHPRQVDGALMRAGQPETTEPARVLDFVCSPEQGESRPRRAPEEPPYVPAGRKRGPRKGAPAFVTFEG